MTAKTLAAVLHRPLFGINSLEALAAEYSGLRDSAVIPVLPCRAGVVFAGAYRVENETPQTLFAPTAVPLAELVALCG